MQIRCDPFLLVSVCCNLVKRYLWIVVPILVENKILALKNKMPYPLGKKYLASFWWQTTNGSTSIYVIQPEPGSLYMTIKGSSNLEGKYIFVWKFIYILKQRENCCCIKFLFALYSMDDGS